MAIQFGSNSVNGIYYGSSKIARVYCGANLTWESPGALTVNYSNPPSGAQWSVDGGTNYHDFGTTVNLVAGTYTITYKSVSNYTTPSSQSVTVTVGGNHVVTANQYVAYGTLRVNYSGTAPSGAQWTHNGGSTWTNFGSSVSVVAGNYTISYKAVSGYTAPSSTSATVTAGNTTTITAGAYTANASTGTLLVKTSGNLPSGAAWSIDGGTTWNSTFGSSSGVTVPVGETLTITFKQVAGYMTPASKSVTITSTGEETVWLESNAYAALVLYVNYPMDNSGNRAPSGAQWSIDGGSTWHDFRVDVSPVPAGTYTITYKPVTGYGTPANESVTITGSTARTQHEIASNNLYTAQSTSYPNAFVVTGADTSPSTSTEAIAAVNGTYVKQSTTTTYGGNTYPVYYNGYYYLWKSKNDGGIALNTSMGNDADGMPSMYNLYHIGEVALTASAMSTNWYVGGAATSEYVSLTFVESNATTPEYGTPSSDSEDEPTTPTAEYLEVTGCATTAMNGTYYFISGDANTAPSGSSSAVLRHANGHYYIFGNGSYSSGTRGWFVANGNSRASDGTPAGSPSYKIGNGNLSVSAAFTDGTTIDGITTTYYNSASSSSSSESAPESQVSYIVSNAGSANGTYVFDSTHVGRDNSPVWTNGTYYLTFGYDGDWEENCWTLTTTTPDGTNSYQQTPSSYYVYTNDSSAPPTSGWHGGCTVSIAEPSSSSSSSETTTAQPRIVVFNSNGYDGQYFLHSGSASSNAAVWKESTHSWYIHQNVNDQYAGWCIYNAATDGSMLKKISSSYSGSTEYESTDGANVVFDNGHTYNGVTSYYGRNAIPDNGITFTGFTTSTYNGTYYATGAESKVSYMDSTAMTDITEYVPIYSNGSAYLVATEYMGQSPIWSISGSPSIGNIGAGNGRTLASLVGSTTWAGLDAYGDPNATRETSTGVYVSGGNSPYLLATGNKSYAGEYRLYSGTASSNTSVWKDIEHDWYIVHVTTGYSPWYIRGDSTPSDSNTYAQIANNYYGDSYNNSDGADVVFAGGYLYDNYKTYYYAS